MWKPVQISGNLFSGNIQDLIGIEECSDYNLQDILPHKRPGKQTNKGDKKKKLSKKKRTTKDVKEHCNATGISPSRNGSTSNCLTNNVNDEQTISDNLDGFETWSNLGIPKEILLAIRDLKFQEPTQIQLMTLPAAVLGRRDILGAAETGSGKTLAFGIPILTGILKIRDKENKANSFDTVLSESDESESEDGLHDKTGLGCVKSMKIQNVYNTKPLYALILTPTRELAMQIKNHLTALAKYTGINIAVIVGGMAAVKQERLLSKGPEIVVATPGRLWELIQDGNPHLCQVDNIRFLAIDETDRMLERGHFHELHDLLERINLDKTKMAQRQNFVFSATLTLVHDLPRYLITKSKFGKSKKAQEMTAVQKLQKIVDLLGITNPKVVDLSQGTGTSGTLTECRINCGIDEKDYYLYYFLKKHTGRTLVFCNSIGCVKRLATLLSLLECRPLPLHASMQQKQRLKNLERFRDTSDSILIATDVAARGLDIPKIEHVIHYQTPRTSESYVHRSGRTARASRAGITVLMVEPSELPSYIKLCKTLEKDADIPVFPVQENYLNAVKQRINLAREVDKLQLQLKKANSEAGWIQKAAEDMDMIVDDDMVRNYDSEEVHSNKKVLDIRRKQLSTLLSKPIFPRGLSGKYPLISKQDDINFVNGEAKQELAVDVMKNAVEKYVKEKRKVVLYKPKKAKLDKKSNIIKLNKFKRDKSVKTRTKRKLNK